MINKLIQIFLKWDLFFLLNHLFDYVYLFTLSALINSLPAKAICKDNKWNLEDRILNENVNNASHWLIFNKNRNALK